jgi:hypothetical protein
VLRVSAVTVEHRWDLAVASRPPRCAFAGLRPYRRGDFVCGSSHDVAPV